MMNQKTVDSSPSPWLSPPVENVSGWKISCGGEGNVVVPRLQPRNTLLRRLLPPGILAGGRSLQCVAFQGWSPGTRIDSLVSDRVTYNLKGIVNPCPILPNSHLHVF